MASSTAATKSGIPLSARQAFLIYSRAIRSLVTCACALAIIALTGCGGGGSRGSNVIAQPLQPGEPRAAGSAAPTSRLTPDATSTSGPYHIATWAYDYSDGKGESATSSQVDQLVSYAQGDSKALTDCHTVVHACKAVFYFRPFATVAANPSSCSQQPDASVLAAAPELWFLHLTGYSDSAHRVQGFDLQGCAMYGMNPNASGLQTWWLNYLRANVNSYDVFFIDEAPMDLIDATSFHSGGGCAGAYCQSTQEIGPDPAMERAHVAFANSLSYSNGSPMSFIYQQAYPSRTQALDLDAFAATTRFVGTSCEGCIANTAAIVVPNNYEPYLNEIAAVTHVGRSSGRYFLIISDGDAPAGSSTEMLQRLATTGIVWLAYRGGFVIVQPNLERYTPNLAIWPEDLIYPSNPVQSMVSGAADLQVAPGVWRREFFTCYQKGKLFGRCAAVVNGNGSAVTVQSSWLTRTYKHIVSLSGGDVLSGGSANVNTTPFVPNSTTIQAGGAILLAQ